VKIARTRKALADDPGSNRLSIDADQLTICLPGKQDLSDSRYQQRIDNPKQDGSRDCHEYSSNQILFHTHPLGQSHTRNDDVDDLDPDERHDDSSDTINPKIVSQHYSSSHRPVLHAAQC
jgi:hypothetical protein